MVTYTGGEQCHGYLSVINGYVCKDEAILLASHGNIKSVMKLVWLECQFTTMKHDRGLVHWLQAVILC